MDDDEAAATQPAAERNLQAAAFAKLRARLATEFEAPPAHAWDHRCLVLTQYGVGSLAEMDSDFVPTVLGVALVLVGAAIAVTHGKAGEATTGLGNGAIQRTGPDELAFLDRDQWTGPSGHPRRPN